MTTSDQLFAYARRQQETYMRALIEQEITRQAAERELSEVMACIHCGDLDLSALAEAIVADKWERP